MAKRNQSTKAQPKPGDEQTKKPKKLPAVREAIHDLGLETSVPAVRKWVKDKYNIVMSDKVAQNYVSTAKKELRGANGKVVVKKPGRPPLAATAARTRKANGNGPNIQQVVEALGQLKELVTRLGKDNLVKLMDAL
jgi:hypothetical protein